MPYGQYGGGMPSELLFLRQLFSQFSPNYLPVAMLAGILVVVIYRPERIHRRSMFRLSCVLLAASIVAPSIISAIGGLLAAATSGTGRGAGQGDLVLLLGVLNVAEPALVPR